MNQNQKKVLVDGFELTYSSDWTEKLEDWRHWQFYWKQASLIWDNVPKNKRIVEIGVGTRFLSNYLKANGWSVQTIDIDKEKHPDIVADVSNFEFSRLTPDVILAFEIFEHLPFPLFSRTIEHISKSSATKIIFSIPWSVRQLFEIRIKLPKMREKNFSLHIRKNNITTPNHYWELCQNSHTNDAVISGKLKGLVSVNSMIDVFEANDFKILFLGKMRYIQYAAAQR